MLESGMEGIVFFPIQNYLTYADSWMLQEPIAFKENRQHCLTLLNNTDMKHECITFI